MATFLNDGRLWEELRKQSKGSKSLVAVTAFLGTRPDQVLQTPKDTLVITNLTEDTVRRGVCSARGALRLLKRHVAVLQARDLHAKIYLFDRKAVVCSANLSTESTERLTEAGVLLSGSEVAPVRKEVARIQREAVVLEESLLRRWAKSEPLRRRGKRRSKSKRKECPLPSTGRVWLIDTYRHTETRQEANAKKRKAKELSGMHAVAAKRIDWFYACGKQLSDRVHDTDWIVLWWQNGQNTRSKTGKLEGPYECLGPVDLGRALGASRYALAIVPRRLRRINPTVDTKMQLRRGRDGKETKATGRMVDPDQIRTLRRLLS